MEFVALLMVAASSGKRFDAIFNSNLELLAIHLLSEIFFASKLKLYRIIIRSRANIACLDDYSQTHGILSSYIYAYYALHAADEDPATLLLPERTSESPVPN